MIIPAQPVTDPAIRQDPMNSPSVSDGTEGKKEKDDYQESEDRLNDIINSIADPVFVKDDRFQFVLVNDALCTMLGMRRENIIGKTLAESLPKDQMDHFFEIDKKVFDSGQEYVSEELLTGQGGKILTIVTKKTRYVDKKRKQVFGGYNTGYQRPQTIRGITPEK